MSKELTTVEIFSEMNEMVEKSGLVFFGTDFFRELPLEELKETFSVDGPILNRSIKNATVSDMEKALDVGVLQLSPKKVFLNIGENDIQKEDFDLDAFISQYEWILYTIHNHIKTRIYIVSVASDSALATRVNARLKASAKEFGCDYIDLIPALSCESPVLRIFDILKFYVRSRPINFCDAMNLPFLRG